MTTPAVVVFPKIERDKPVPREAIEVLVNHIVEEFKPEKVILFGSHAYGEPQPWSDVDLLIVMETELTSRQQRMKISRRLSPHPFGLDLVVHTPPNLKHRLEIGDVFLREVINKGKVLYERTNR